ncbi:UNVERIFIED_CONTAM: hypothetical protein Sradi_1769600 [Sesamum radiatum]|uniref:Zinc knuckle CX2CX4HX4C domain-containing protein n=1 Tax=Sesamum radiatum TaxID=300843 RepID=A0AAW2TVS0_SESRA
MNRGIATHIGNRLGISCDMEMDETGRSWGASLRIRATINVNNPLKRALKIRTTMGDEIMMFFTYERLPKFCYYCGCLEHIAKYCETHFAEEFSDRGPTPLRTLAPSTSADEHMG